MDKTHYKTMTRKPPQKRKEKEKEQQCRAGCDRTLPISAFAPPEQAKSKFRHSKNPVCRDCYNAKCRVQNRNNRHERVIMVAGRDITAGHPIGDNPRNFRFVLQLILRAQLTKLFNDVPDRSIERKLAIEDIIDEMVSDMVAAFSRGGVRIRRIVKAEEDEAKNTNTAPVFSKVRDAAKTLGLSWPTDWETVHNTYRTEIQTCHADKGHTDEESQSRVRDLNDAHSLLRSFFNG